MDAAVAVGTGKAVEAVDPGTDEGRSLDRSRSVVAVGRKMRMAGAAAAMAAVEVGRQAAVEGEAEVLVGELNLQASHPVAPVEVCDTVVADVRTRRHRVVAEAGHVLLARSVEETGTVTEGREDRRPEGAAAV